MFEMRKVLLLYLHKKKWRAWRKWSENTVRVRRTNDAENAARSKRSAALGSQNHPLSGRYVEEPNPLPTSSERERQTCGTDAHSLLSLIDACCCAFSQAASDATDTALRTCRQPDEASV